MGGWGNLGSQTQKGVTTYSISANRQRPLAGALHSAIFNTFRRTRNQILYWLPMAIGGYAVIQWAIEKYVTPLPITGMLGSDQRGEADNVVSTVIIMPIRSRAGWLGCAWTLSLRDWCFEMCESAAVELISGQQSMGKD